MNHIVSHLTSLLIITSLLHAANPSEPASQPEADAILLEVAQRMEGIDQSATITITVTNRRDSIRVRYLDLAVHHPQPSDSIAKQTYVEMIAPDKAAGQKFWEWKMKDGSEQRWIFLPGSGKLRQISDRQRNRRQIFDISALELSPSSIARHINSIDADRQTGDNNLIVMKCIERPSPLLRRAKQDRKVRRPDYKILWVNKSDLMVQKAEFYNSRDKLTSRIEVSETAQIGQYKVVSLIHAFDAKKKTTTKISIENISLDSIKNTGLFSPSKK